MIKPTRKCTIVTFFLMWVKQCHKPPMTGNGKHTTYLWWWLEDGANGIVLHTLVVLQWDLIDELAEQSPMCLWLWTKKPHLAFWGCRSLNWTRYKGVLSYPMLSSSYPHFLTKPPTWAISTYPVVEAVLISILVNPPFVCVDVCYVFIVCLFSKPKKCWQSDCILTIHRSHYIMDPFVNWPMNHLFIIHTMWGPQDS